MVLTIIGASACVAGLVAVVFGGSCERLPGTLCVIMGAYLAIAHYPY